MDHATVMNNCDAKADRFGLEALTDTERVVVLVSRANFEVEMGGLSSFFYNSTGDHAVETLSAMKAVGATLAAQSLQAAMATFPNGSPSADREQRHAEWQTVSVLLGAFDAEFCRDEPDVFSRLCTFIDNHASELREHWATTT